MGAAAACGAAPVGALRARAACRRCRARPESFCSAFRGGSGAAAAPVARRRTRSASRCARQTSLQALGVGDQRAVGGLAALAATASGRGAPRGLRSRARAYELPEAAAAAGRDAGVSSDHTGRKCEERERPAGAGGAEVERSHASPSVAGLSARDPWLCGPASRRGCLCRDWQGRGRSTRITPYLKTASDLSETYGAAVSRHMRGGRMFPARWRGVADGVRQRVFAQRSNCAAGSARSAASRARVRRRPGSEPPYACARRRDGGMNTVHATGSFPFARRSLFAFSAAAEVDAQATSAHTRCARRCSTASFAGASFA